MSKAAKLLLGSLLVGLVAAPVFLLWPGLDLEMSGRFFADGEFMFQRVAWLRPLPALVRGASIALGAGLLLLLAARLRWTLGNGRLPTRSVVYLLAVLALGPGLLTNTVLKDQFGRARPREIVEFGGDRRFTPPLIPSDQCARNCSFVAGDPAFGFYFSAWALALPAMSGWLLPLSLMLGALLGLVRIGMGAHFLSDVIYSGVVNCALAAALAWPLLKHFPPNRN